jgi:hypothetical protein
MDYITIIRQLARSQYWQNIYVSAKEIGSIKIFDNDNNYSGLQSLFLYWLRVYDLLYSELIQKEWKYLDEEVINNDIRCDAFLYWRGLQKEQELNKNKQEQKISNLQFKNPGKVSTFNVDFTSGGSNK